MCGMQQRPASFSPNKEGLENAINSICLVPSAASVNDCVTGMQDVVPYKDIPNGLGENADGVQDW
jgi:hypothetical protein